MPGYLLDTNAISALAPRPGKPPTAATQASAFRAWVQQHDEVLFLSSVTVAEIQAGVSRLERRGAARRARHLSHWLHAILELYGSRVLPLDSRVALETGRLLDRAIGKGSDPGFEDAAIAATAAVHGLTVVTANIAHFKPFDVRMIDLPS